MIYSTHKILKLCGKQIQDIATSCAWVLSIVKWPCIWPCTFSLYKAPKLVTHFLSKNPHYHCLYNIAIMPTILPVTSHQVIELNYHFDTQFYQIEGICHYLHLEVKLSFNNFIFPHPSHIFQPIKIIISPFPSSPIFNLLQIAGMYD
jgi:hypothetical protein